MIKTVLSTLALTCFGIGVICYQDEQFISNYADDYGINKADIYALVSHKDKCPSEFNAHFDEYFGICWNEYALAQWNDNFTDTDVGLE